VYVERIHAPHNQCLGFRRSSRRFLAPAGRRVVCHLSPAPPLLFPAPLRLFLQEGLQEAQAALLEGDPSVQGQIDMFQASLQAVQANPGVVQGWAVWTNEGGDDSKGVCGREAHARMLAMNLRCIVYLI
jgi:hypothetical protein